MKILLLAILSIAITTSCAPIATSSITGENMKLEQRDKWRLKVVFADNNGSFPKKGSFEFQSLKCGGDFHTNELKSDGSAIVLQQNMKFGSCVPNCEIIIERDMTSYQESCNGRITGHGKFENNNTTDQLKMLSNKSHAKNSTVNSQESNIETKTDRINTKDESSEKVIVNSPKKPVALRSEPKDNSTIVATIEHDVVLTKISTQGDWVKVKHATGRMEGWIHNESNTLKDIDLPSNQINNKKIETSDTVAINSPQKLVAMRSKPEPTASVEKYIEHNVVLTKISIQGDWVKVKLPDGKEGWINNEGNIFSTPPKSTKTPAVAGELYLLDGARYTRSLAVSPDGKHLVSGHCGGKIYFWDPSQAIDVTHYTISKLNPEKKQLLDSDPCVTALAFSSDSKLLASGEDRDQRIIIWDIASGQQLHTINAKFTDSHIKNLSFSPDGKILVAALDEAMPQVRFWDTATGTEISHVPPYNLLTDFSAYAVAFSPDGKLLAAAGSKDTILILDPFTGQKLLTIGSTGRSYFTSVAFSPDGKLLAASNANPDTPVQIFNPNTGKLLHTLIGHSGSGSLTFSSDGKYLITGDDDANNIMIWDPITGKRLHVFRDTKATSTVTKLVALTSDNKFLASADHNTSTIQIWDMQQYFKPGSSNQKRAAELGVSQEEYLKKKEGIEQLRASNTFEGYAEAFLLSRAKEDFVALQKLATTSEQKKKLEYYAIMATNDKTKIFDTSIKLGDFQGTPSIRDSRLDRSVLLIPAAAKFSRARFSGTGTMRVNKKSPLGSLQYGYRVQVKHTLQYTLSTTNSINFIISDSKKDNEFIRKEQIVTYEITPGKNGTSVQKLDFGEALIAEKTEFVGGTLNVQKKIEGTPELVTEIIKVEQL
jgi:WD40 repeat protein